ncbi:hypothetical protein C8R43DRAFT_944858 [Mycena crocata]|nr:hypothetical protein C8R43DRAFT_944858 [Mycena crocata]
MRRRQTAPQNRCIAGKDVAIDVVSTVQHDLQNRGNVVQYWDSESKVFFWERSAESASRLIDCGKGYPDSQSYGNIDTNVTRCARGFASTKVTPVDLGVIMKLQWTRRIEETNHTKSSYRPEIQATEEGHFWSLLRELCAEGNLSANIPNVNGGIFPTATLMKRPEPERFNQVSRFGADPVFLLRVKGLRLPSTTWRWIGDFASICGIFGRVVSATNIRSQEADQDRPEANG